MKNTLETRKDDPEELVSKFPGTVFDDMPSMKSLLTTLSPIDQQRFKNFGWGPSINPRFQTLVEAINYQIAIRPKAVAAEYQGKYLTYSQLDAAANKLALILYSHGVRRGDVVCLYLRRSFSMLVGIVAAMRVGAAYVPQHVGVAPSEMLSHIAKISSAKVILTLSTMAPKVAASQHQSLIFINSMMDSPAPDNLDMGPGRRVGQVLSIAFDMAA
ncbi:AMP-binding protein [Halomonas sp. SpR8]|uniref:AMP-binding protein n=1 Tax=Halomonas sp. SpR8 TaxID=3050463 RepID=UPI0027E5A578|nr:AMP-binding protein [Halomonas sp. SpR8]MDQ7729738.1 AMP-binding protein [Halomonas sp. SpR8]